MHILNLSKISLFLLSVAAWVTLSGCGNKVIDHVTVTPSEDLQSLQVLMEFKPDVVVPLTGNFIIGNYGTLFMVASQGTQPFQLGFNLNRGVLTDPAYIGLRKTSLLPNGAPSMLPYPVVEIKGTEPISQNFDLYGYLDVDYLAWIGAAAIFDITASGDIGTGLALTQVFQRDALGNPTIYASIFGPSTTEQRKGGIALFANVKSLMDAYEQTGDLQARTYKPEKKAYKHRIGETPKGLRFRN